LQRADRGGSGFFGLNRIKELAQQTPGATEDIRNRITGIQVSTGSAIGAVQKIDIVLCRNVAIHFTEQDRTRLFLNISQVLAPDGCLLIGSTESITGLCPEYEVRRYFRSAFYQLRRN
jgi:chemotaxis protein methyltransferase CheR